MSMMPEERPPYPKPQKKATNMIWEEMPNYNYGTIYRRTKVFGGWLVESCADVYHTGDPTCSRIGIGFDYRVSVTFVPDSLHEWEL